MLSKFHKFAPFLLVGLLGYLGYSVTESTGPRKAQGKDAAAITRDMLKPGLVPIQAHASPADRDPFEVEWASYQAGTGRGLVARPEANARVASQPASAPSVPVPATAPAVGQPPMPGPVGGIFVAEEFRITVIGDKLYKPGDLVGGDDPSRCWLLESVQRDHIVLRFGETTIELRMPAGSESPSRHPGPVKGEPKP